MIARLKMNVKICLKNNMRNTFFKHTRSGDMILTLILCLKKGISVSKASFAGHLECMKPDLLACFAEGHRWDVFFQYKYVR